ncbi:MAG TPA: VWA domain-containing protein [Nordella sp.]|nr:VWA domain-containing protein [Nordella sp.]
MTDDGLIDSLLRSARFAQAIDRRGWESVRDAFPGPAFDLWIDAFDRVSARIGDAAAPAAFAAGSVEVARLHGTDLALTTAETAIGIARAAGVDAALRFLGALPAVAALLEENAAFRVWLRTIEEAANLAPHAASLIIRASGFVLGRLSVLAFRAWASNGIRQSSGDPAKAALYFAATDMATLQAFERDPDDVVFTDVEASLRAFLIALWKIRPVIRAASVRPGGRVMRRAAFDGAFIRVPEIYAGYRGAAAAAHYHAVFAHIGAHLIFGRAKLPVGSLRPVQVALVGLIEDARVEALAAEEYPGLRRLWARFHVAEPGTALTAELLMMRLARALADPLYVDDDPWIVKARRMFRDARDQWRDPAISRRIGGLLGNDIGQMRIQFNARSHVIEPSYRDDNTGLWDFGETPPEQAETAETLLEAVRLEEKEEPDKPEQRNRNDPDAAPANRAGKVTAVPEDAGMPIARHSEWDHVAGQMRHDWTTIVEFKPKPAGAEAIDAILADHADVERRIARLVKAAKVSRPVRMRRQPQGDRLDLDAAIRAMIDHRAGLVPDTRLYETQEMRARDLSVLVLLDISESTRDRVRDTTTSILALERAAAALLAQAMADLGDPFAMHAFCSNGREDVRYFRIKGFAEDNLAAVKGRLAGLRGMLSTRLGAALRQAGAEIAPQATHRKLVLVITDGEPADIDVADKRYLVEDARKAVLELSRKGIDVFCVGLDSGGESYLPRIFGLRGYLMINRLEALPEKLPMLYFRLTI